MSEPKRRILDALCGVQAELFNIKEQLGEVPTTKSNADVLSGMYDKLNGLESTLAQVLNESWWEQN